MTYTYAIMEVSQDCFDEIQRKLEDAGYDHAIQQDIDGTWLLDMHGIALQGIGRRTGKEKFVVCVKCRTRAKGVKVICDLCGGDSDK